MAVPVIITCAVTGGTDHAHKNPAVPVTPKQIADAAVQALAGGRKSNSWVHASLSCACR